MTDHMIWLTAEGKVVLDDEMLISIEKSGVLSGGGDPDPPTTNGTCGGHNSYCLNTIHCKTATNANCTNQRICPNGPGDHAETIDP